MNKKRSTRPLNQFLDSLLTMLPLNLNSFPSFVQLLTILASVKSPPER